MVEEMELRELITHSFIVGALLAFSLSAHAGAIAIDGMSVEANPVDAAANSNAVLHREVGLRQGGGKGKDVWEAPLNLITCEQSSAPDDVDDAQENPECENLTPISPTAPRAESLSDLLAINREATSEGSALLLLILIGALVGFCCWRSPSTK